MIANEKTQKELFEFEAPKKAARPRFGSLLQRGDFSLTLTAEKIVFVSIGIIMLAVIFFALGVEKGKSLAAKAAVPAIPVQAVATQVPAKAASVPLVQAKATATATNITPKNANAPIAITQQSADKPYTVVAATFYSQDSAAREVAALKKKSLEAFVIKSEPYYLACVGSFANRDSAQKILNKVRQMHRDAYVRLR